MLNSIKNKKSILFPYHLDYIRYYLLKIQTLRLYFNLILSVILKMRTGSKLLDHICIYVIQQLNTKNEVLFLKKYDGNHHM